MRQGLTASRLLHSFFFEHVAASTPIKRWKRTCDVTPDEKDYAIYVAALHLIGSRNELVNTEDR